MVLRVIDERLAVDGEGGEDGRSVVPGEVAVAVLDDEVRVTGDVVLLHELGERDLLLGKLLVVENLRMEASQPRARPCEEELRTLSWPKSSPPHKLSSKTWIREPTRSENWFGEAL